MANTSTVKFGLGQVNNETPEWANWIFRGWFIISKAVVGYIAALAALKELNISITTLMVITLTINLLLDPIMYGFSKLFGIVPDQADSSSPFIADKQVTPEGDVKNINPVALPAQPSAPITTDGDNKVIAPQSSSNSIETENIGTKEEPKWTNGAPAQAAQV